MKKIIIAFCIFCIGLNAIAQELVKLPEPQKTGGMPLMQALNERSSSRDFIEKDLTDQQLSNLLWAAFGINREDIKKRTAPSSHNSQDILIYITTSKGVFLYHAEEHALEQISEKDLRVMAGTQDFVKTAALNLIYVSDLSKVGKTTDVIKKKTAAAHCGFIGQNVYLYCASEGLITVFRAMIEREKISEAFNLPDGYEVMYGQTVGYSK